MSLKVLSALTFLFFMVVTPVVAHPGRTASDGCHYCRTNCDEWGEAWDERHCHGGGNEPVVESQPIQIQPTAYIPPTAYPTRMPTRTPTSIPVTDVPTATPSQPPQPTSKPVTDEPVATETTDSKPSTIGETTAGVGILGGMGYGAYWVAKKFLSKFIT